MFYHEQLYAAHSNSIYIYDGKQFSLYYELPFRKAKLQHCTSTTIKSWSAQKIKACSVWTATTNYLIPFLRGISQPFFKTRPENTGSEAGKKVFSWWMEKQSAISGTKRKTRPASVPFYRCCSEDKQGNLWIGTFNGLNMFHPSSQTFNTLSETWERLEPFVRLEHSLWPSRKYMGRYLFWRSKLLQSGKSDLSSISSSKNREWRIELSYRGAYHGRRQHNLW